MRRSVWLWVLLIILAILVLGLIFGGYRKGTKTSAPYLGPEIELVSGAAG